MEMDKKLVDAINEQIKNEIYSAYLYLSMSAYFESIKLKGFSNWMKSQAKEEINHAMKMFNHLADRGARVILKEFPAPPSEFASPLDIFEKTLAHEKKVTGLIKNLYALADELGDSDATAMLQWFVTEQIEEEESPGKILEKLKAIGDKDQELLLLDKELAQRE